VPEPIERFRRDPRGTRDEIRSQAQAVAPVLEVRAPATGEPADLERCAETVASSATGQNVQHVPGRLLVLAEYPVAVLTHDGEPMEDDGLAGTDQCPATPPVERLRQLDVGIRD